MKLDWLCRTEFKMLVDDAQRIVDVYLCHREFTSYDSKQREIEGDLLDALLPPF